MKLRASLLPACILAAGLTVAALSGCMKEVPVLTEKQAQSEATLDEQRAWAAQEIDAVIEVTSTEGLWEDTWEGGLRWPAQKDAILEGSGRELCRFESGETNPAQLLVMLWTVPLEEDPFLLADRVRGMWESEGWDISDVVRKEDLPGRSSIHFRADRDDGALLSLRASDSAGGKLLMLDVQAACSNHPTVAW